MVKRRALYKVATRRWLRAMETAKILFENDGYHKHYLEEIEHFIRRKKMYSPKINEDLIPKLYKLAKKKEDANDQAHRQNHKRKSRQRPDPREKQKNDQ